MGSFAAAALTGAEDRPSRGRRQRDLLPLPLSVSSAEDMARPSQMKIARAVRSRAAWITVLIRSLYFVLIGGAIDRARVLGPPTAAQTVALQTLGCAAITAKDWTAALRRVRSLKNSRPRSAYARRTSAVSMTQTTPPSGRVDTNGAKAGLALSIGIR